jgi:hypothetical protein
VVTFDDEHAVADAGLVLPATLAQQLGLRELIDDGTVALGHARVWGRQWWDASISWSSGTRSPEFGVRRVPVPS